MQGKLQEYGGVEHNADGVMGGSSKASLMAVNLQRFMKSQLRVTDHVLSFFFRKQITLCIWNLNGSKMIQNWCPRTLTWLHMILLEHVISHLLESLNSKSCHESGTSGLRNCSWSFWVISSHGERRVVNWAMCTQPTLGVGCSWKVGFQFNSWTCSRTFYTNLVSDRQEECLSLFLKDQECSYSWMYFFKVDVLCLQLVTGFLWASIHLFQFPNSYWFNLVE